MSRQVRHSGLGPLFKTSVVGLALVVLIILCYINFFSGPYKGGLNSDVRGTITYGQSASLAPSTSTSWNATNPTCGDVDYSILKPAKPFQAESNPALTLFLNYTFPVFFKGIARTLVNGKSYRVDDDAYPTLFHINDNPDWKPEGRGEERNLMFIPDTARGKEVRLVMQSSGIPGTHPYHSHGRGLKVIASGSGNFTHDDLDKVNMVDTANVVERDTIVIPSLGWVLTQCVLFLNRCDARFRTSFPSRFTADNPGVWPIHCHVGKSTGCPPDPRALITKLRVCRMASPKWDAGTNR
jgi:Multicopper oxidase